MAQITTGLRRVLNHPHVYVVTQRLLTSDRRTRHWVEQILRPRAGQRVLDIGCGPADLLRFLPEVEYVGFDSSADYIEAARARFGGRGRFEQARVDAATLEGLGRFDLVLARGVLHHLDDAEAEALFRLARAALSPGARLVTLDACWAEGQHPVARLLIARDRGQNVRDATGYRALAARVFDEVRVEVRHDLMRVPYTHCSLEASLAP
ncbi:MAG: class I SAM-dependent methyltransferase [Deltaproteobacteria bacterium]|nr:class I SAM-dependent methyltransferase [Deltaproteobacteria bacterium]